MPDADSDPTYFGILNSSLRGFSATKNVNEKKIENYSFNVLNLMDSINNLKCPNMMEEKNAER